MFLSDLMIQKKLPYFVSIFNDAFDLLNVRSTFCKTKNTITVLINDSFDKLKNYAENIIEYIKDLRDFKHMSLLQSNRKTGFFGFIVCFTNMYTYVSSTSKSKVSDGLFAVDEVDGTSADRLFDHDYLTTLWSLSLCGGSVIKYISGFGIKKLLGKICHVYIFNGEIHRFFINKFKK